MTSKKVSDKDRLLGPSASNFPWPDGDGPFRVNLGFAADGSGLRCISVAIGPADPKSPATITRTLMKDLPIDEITRAKAEEWRKQFAAQGFHAATKQLVMDPADPRGRTSRFYIEVASVYEGARDTGKPTSAVAEKWNVSISRAATWVRRARQRNLIPPTSQGRRQ